MSINWRNGYVELRPPTRRALFLCRWRSVRLRGGRLMQQFLRLKVKSFNYYQTLHRAAQVRTEGFWPKRSHRALLRGPIQNEAGYFGQNEAIKGLCNPIRLGLNPAAGADNFLCATGLIPDPRP